MDKLQSNLLHAFISVLTLLSMAACDRSSSGIDYSGRYWETEEWKKKIEEMDKKLQEQEKSTWDAAEKLKHGMICKLDKQTVAVTKEGRHIIITPANNPDKVTTIPIVNPIRYKEKYYNSDYEEGPPYRTCRLVSRMSRKKLNTLIRWTDGLSEFEKEEFLKGYVTGGGYSENEDDCLYYDLDSSGGIPGLHIAKLEGKFRSSHGMATTYATYLGYRLEFDFTDKKVIGRLSVLGPDTQREIMNFNYVTYEGSPAWLARHRFFNFKGKNSEFDKPSAIYDTFQCE